jgi:hypothetical protein
VGIDEVIESLDDTLAPLPDNHKVITLPGIDFVFSHGVAYYKNEKVFDAVLKEEYRGHSVNFWGSLQQLHDKSCNWGENGEITSAGKEQLVIVRSYANKSGLKP